MRLPDNRILLAIAIPVVLGATAYATFKPADDPHASSHAEAAAVVAGEADFTLHARQAGGRMLFADKDGKQNPTLDVRPGQQVRLTIVNDDFMPHDFVISELGVHSRHVLPGKQETFTFTARQEGSFEYFCSILGHRAAGMRGTIVVGTAAPAAVADSPSVSRAANDLPRPLAKRAAKTVRFEITTKELTGRLADGTTYQYWTFDGKVPGPMLRVREGDTVELQLDNDKTSFFSHSIDLHAVTGPGGGAVATQTAPGKSTSFKFKALHAGLYVYHCATPMVAHHITSGMYGLILVEPEGGLEPVDREFYVMQGELYTEKAFGQTGAAGFSEAKLLDEDPEYFVFNGAAGALTGAGALQAKVGEKVRIFFGDAGPNFTSSLHLIGETFDRAYPNASLDSEPDRNVQSALTAAGGASIVEFKLDVPGRYVLVDHSLSRMERGLSAHLQVSGPEDESVFHGHATSTAGH